MRRSLSPDKAKSAGSDKLKTANDPTSSSRASSKEQDPEEVPVPIDPIQEQKWVVVFRRLRAEGGIHRDKLEQAVALAGFGPHVKLEWVDQILRRMTRYNTLDLKEFIKFVYRYAARERSQLQQAFARYDSAQSGVLDDDQFAPLLTSLGITALDTDFRELRAEIGQHEVQGFNLKQVQRAVEIMHERLGFSSQDIERFRRAFKKFDADSSGDLDVQEITAVLGWIGYASSVGETTRILRELGVAADRKFKKHEFLALMRKVRQREMDRLRVLRDKADNDGNGLIDMMELQHILYALGYCPDLTAIYDVAQDTKSGLTIGDSHKSGGQALRSSAMDTLEPGHEFEFSMSDLWNFVELFRARDGFSRSEVAEIWEAFKRYDRDGEGEISTLEAGKVLRWLGYRISWESQKELVAEVDVNHSGRIDVIELQKLVRKCREQDVKAMEKAFREYDVREEGTLTEQQAHAALRSLGYATDFDESSSSATTAGNDGEDDDEDDASSGASEEWHNSSAADSTGGFDLHAFLRLGLQCRSDERITFRKYVGYSTTEIENLKNCFNHFDIDDSGSISHSELKELLATSFPELATSAKLRPYLLKLLEEADANLNGGLDFPDFLRLMRQVHDLQERDMIIKEQAAVKEASFRHDEVEEFRELFMHVAFVPPGCDEISAEITFAEFARMVSRACPLGDRNRAQLAVLYEEVTGRKDFQADFPEFLRLMSRLLKDNFANMQEHTRAAVEGSSPKRMSRRRSSVRKSLSRVSLCPMPVAAS